MVAGLRRIEGVYRVDLYHRQRKLSVRFDGLVLDFSQLARGLNVIVDALSDSLSAGEASCPACQSKAPSLNWQQALRDSGPARWIRSKYEEISETFTAARILVQAQKRKPASFLPSTNTTIDILNDILVLYLIKIHWQMILYGWIRRPWQYKSEWMATFYLVFLLMRSKMPKSQ